MIRPTSQPPPQRGPLLIVAAWAPELRGLGRGPRARDGTAAFTRGIVGVGLVEAAAGTARLLATIRPRAVILLGTAGIFAPAKVNLPLGGAAVVSHVHLASATVAAGGAYLPPPLPTSVATARALTRRLAAAAGDVPTITVACPLGITRTAVVARRLQAATRAHAENLEAFAVARAAAIARVPFAAVLGLANVVGPGGHDQWRAHGDAAARAACAVVRAYLDRFESQPTTTTSAR